MTDLSPLLTVSGNHLFLTNWGEEGIRPEDIIACVRNYGKEFSPYPDDYYAYLVRKWKGRLKRYPVGYKKSPLFIYLAGIGRKIPYIMLPDLIPFYHEIHRAIGNGVLGSSPPRIGAFVRNGDRVMEIFGDPDIHRELSRLMKSPPERIRRERNDHSTVYYARRSGYFVATSSGLDILPALRIAEDKSSLRFLMLPLSEGLENRLEYFQGYIRKHRENFAESPEPKDADYLQVLRNMDNGVYEEYEILGGVSPQQGRNSRLEFPLEKDRPDGEKDRVNYHDYSGITIVAEGKIFARKVPYREGRDGIDIYGSKISVTKGKDIPITLEGDIGVEESEDFTFYRANTTGVARMDGNRLILKESLLVEGHVDYHTGNIKFKGDIIIRGDVKPGFTVLSGGNVIIEGSVENGTRIRTSEELLIRQGIIGKDTVVESGKDLHCGFIQNSRVSCRASLFVDKNITGARVCCRGLIRVEGKGLSRKRIGVVNGSECTSYLGMNLLSAGSELNETVLRTGYDHFLEEKIGEMDEVRSAYELKTRQIMEALPADMGNVEKIKGLPPQKRAAIAETLKKLKDVNEKIRLFDRKRSQMEGFLYNRNGESLSVKLEEGLKAPVTVQIGEILDLMPAMDGKGTIVLQGNELKMIRE